MNSCDPGRYAIERTRNSSYLIVDGRWSIQRHDHVVDTFDDALSIPLEQETGRQNGDSNARRANQCSEPEEICMHQGLTTGKDDPLYLQPADIFEMTLQFNGREFLL